MRLADSLSAARFVAWHDLRRSLRQRETWVWSFVMPVVFFYFFGLLQGGGASDPTRPDALTLVAPGGGVLVDELERRLVERGFEVQRVAVLDPLVAKPKRLLELPEHFSRDVLEGAPATVEFSRDGGGNSYELDRFRVARASYSVLADVIALAAAGQDVGAAGFEELRALPRTLAIDARPAGRRERVPSGREQSIPGTMVMFTMILLLMSSGMAIVVERRQGLLRRLAATPLTRLEVGAGKWLAIFGLGVVQLGYAMAVGALGFGVSWGPDAAFVVLVLLLWAAFNASLALALCALVSSEGQVVGISVLSANVLSALGGCWWPIEITPPWMQELASWLPTGWVMNALHRLMIFQTGPTGALAAAVWLVLGALGLAWFGSRRFAYEA
jgi:ABC-2 type transport system permease protein